MPKPSPYKTTIELPKTPFPIAYAHEKVETHILDDWGKGNLYDNILRKNSGGPSFILHDGPPYPNGKIHLGHALNKILKDIILKFKWMAGFDAPYIPGWDCHGLPIESQLIKELGGGKVREMGKVDFRKVCAEYAMKYVDLQRSDFIRLGVLGDWQHPYLTLQREYEVRAIKLFGELVEKGYIFRSRKPIHWCIHDETALAEAELEYEDHVSPSIFVAFGVKSLPSGLQKLSTHLGKLSIVIWTTTPWTLPANVAVALHPSYIYVALKTAKGVFVVAEGRAEAFAHAAGLGDVEVIEKMEGSAWEGAELTHPFLPDRKVVAVLDNMVTLDQGTGAVHIAPGHGEEDYMVGLKYKLPIVMPVDGKGFLTEEAGPFVRHFVGHDWLIKIKKHELEKCANCQIIDHLNGTGALLARMDIRHSYPHCWRCKNPVIFRATEQWFLSVDHEGLRQASLAAIQKTAWYPAWGESRITSMVEGRPDWCLSRQRSWGIPVPAFYCEACNTPHMTGKYNEAIQAVVREGGTDAYFQKSAHEILGRDVKCQKCGGSEFRKEEDILDVWFESGSSHYAVLKDRAGLTWPADLYLEGSDQHRGWFQTSLLTSMAVFGRPPYNSVLTHGFTVDESGKKMSKSLGNVVDPHDVVKQYGADVLRLWVASSDFRNDVAASPNILRQVQEAYGKIRNTCRFLIGNLRDFDPEKDAVAHSDLREVDRYALIRLRNVVDRIRRGYDQYEFHIVFHTANEFCTNDLSAFYLDVVKDRLYCDGRGSLSRRSVQTVLHQCLLHLMTLLAPILSFTMEEIRKELPTIWGLPHSIFLFELPAAESIWLDRALEERWDALLRVRAEVYRLIEKDRSEKKIGSSLEAAVTLFAEGDLLEFLKKVEDLLPGVFMVSHVEIQPITAAAKSSSTSAQQVKQLSITVSKIGGERCERCWIYAGDVGTHAKYPTLCGRCGSVVEKWYNLPVLQESE